MDDIAAETVSVTNMASGLHEYTETEIDTDTSSTERQRTGHTQAFSFLISDTRDMAYLGSRRGGGARGRRLAKEGRGRSAGLVDEARLYGH
jgi:hypothetical protein